VHLHPHRVDVLVIGAGPAGAASALALQRDGCASIAIIGRPKRHHIGEAAAPDTAAWLRRLGLPGHLDRLGHDAHEGTLAAWGSGVPSVDDFVRHGQGYGWRLDRASFDRWLLEHASNRGALVLDGVVKTVVRDTGGRWIARVERRCGSIEIVAGAIVLAAGRSVSRQLGLGDPPRHLDRLLALAVTIRRPTSAFGFERYSVVEAARQGWWYAARLPNGDATVMLMTDPDLALAYRFCDPNRLLAAWRETKVVSEFVRPPDVASVAITVHPAGTQYLPHACGAQWCAVGDALMALDPLTASGISGALADGIEAAEVIGSTLGSTDSVDRRRELLRAYASRADETLRRFAKERCDTYAREHRWSASPFWHRRLAVDMGPEGIRRPHRVADTRDPPALTPL
jgi:flavin-dependent dehydrogenase